MILVCVGGCNPAHPPANPVVLLDHGWRFHSGDPDTDRQQSLAYPAVKSWILPTANGFTNTPTPLPAASFTPDVAFVNADFDDSKWRTLDVPHDWAVEGPFDINRSGDTGKLPYPGVGWYRKTFTVAEGAAHGYALDVDGAMSYSSVYLNGRLMGGWPYGYASYSVDLTPAIKTGKNVLAIRLENPDDSSRWYPGAGLYRNVYLRKVGQTHLVNWSTFVTTPKVTDTAATVDLTATLTTPDSERQVEKVVTEIYYLNGPRRERVATDTLDQWSKQGPVPDNHIHQTFLISRPKLWSVDSPNLYMAETTILGRAGKVLDRTETTFGIRTIEFTLHDGFHLNGQRLPLNGVCNHHDLGALGSAVNYRATERQLEMLKAMGCNAIRTSHNPPSPELMDLCQKMGFVVMCEAFDCWHTGKTSGDYHNVFDDWAEADVRSMVRHYRNNPAVITWSIGNEIPDQWRPAGPELAKNLTAFVHNEDPTRPTSVGCNAGEAGFNGYQNGVDVFGINYFTINPDKFRAANPAKPFFYSESSSTITSRGEYFFGKGKDDWKSDFQLSSDDLHYPGWATSPDMVFKSLETHPDMAGEFVWTGWDYLGEPTPYGGDQSKLPNFTDPVAREKAETELKAHGKIKSPARSSYFGIIDLAGFPKDRFYLYQAHWRPDFPMAHLLPHWTWPGREGQPTWVQVYTSGDEAEVFLNGKSLGRKKKPALEYRLAWNDVPYQPGELTVVAYRNGKEWATDTVRTAGPAAMLKVEREVRSPTADGKDLAFITVTVVDVKGNTVPQAKDTIHFEVTGPADLIATDNGDATSLLKFQTDTRPAYNGKCLAILRTRQGKAGTVTVKVSTPGLPDAKVLLEIRQ